MTRGSGVLMHITSLPSPYGIGSLGKAAYEFADFLVQAGQRYWQVLPLTPTGYGDSPYQSFSSYAGNPYLIDLDLLIEEGILIKEDIPPPENKDHSKIDYGEIYIHRNIALKKAFARSYGANMPQVEDFVEQNKTWLLDYALFMALKEHFQMRSFLEWEDEAIKNREPAALESYRVLLEEKVNYHCFVQYLFSRQWQALHAYCNEKGVSIIGDMPIYVSMDSADLWAAPEYFLLHENRLPRCVSGVPPDYFSKTGQLWGNPLYDWEALKQEGYGWWVRRVEGAAARCDLLRIDHFRGLSSWCKIPYGEETAQNGVWMPGPGRELIDAIKGSLPNLQIIAEDLGLLSPDVYELLAYAKYPGMRVLEFAFDGNGANPHLPHNHVENCVCYTGTHDNESVLGFTHRGDPAEVGRAVEYLGLIRREGFNWGFIRGGLGSPACICICQMQDVLGLDARMNTPSTQFNNWDWRMAPGAITGKLTQRLLRLTRMFGRG